MSGLGGQRTSLGWPRQQGSGVKVADIERLRRGLSDLDGHVWEVAHNPGFGLADDGTVVPPIR